VQKRGHPVSQAVLRSRSEAMPDFHPSSRI
jgi:hypothetical protein